LRGEAAVAVVVGADWGRRSWGERSWGGRSWGGREAAVLEVDVLRRQLVQIAFV